MVMAPTEFYSVVLKKRINIPKNKITEKIINGRKFAFGTYVANGKNYKASKIIGMVKK